jgi:hypothetical protein
VAKELTSTTNVEMLGNPDFEFQILNATDTNPFIGEGTGYTIYDTATNTPIGTGTVGQHGFFTLKAGQRAEFTGIDENAGQYRVRERIPNEFVGQYDSFYVDGTVVDESNLTSTGGNQFTGVVSPVKDISNGSTVFTYNNHVDAAKLGYLTISKVVEGTADGREFNMTVLLNGQPIPVGTPYTLYDTEKFMNGQGKHKIANNPDRAVTTAGVVTIPAGATAEIDNILAGTTFHVSEESGSAEGYVVRYGIFIGEQWAQIAPDGVSGTIPVKVDENAHVCLVVTNAENAASVTIPGTKLLRNGAYDPTTTHTYCFTIDLVDINGNEPGDYGVSYSETKAVQVTGSNPAEFDFVINYLASDFTGTSTLTYEIRENKPDPLESTHDSSVYTAVVTVTKAANGMIDAKLTSLTKDGTAVESAGFVNTLLGELDVSKIVDGNSADQNRSFEFFFWLADANRRGVSNWPVAVTRNGQTQERVTDSGGRVYLSFKHGETVTIQGIPLGYTWRVQEQNYGNYIAKWEATPESCITQSGSDYVEGNFPAAGVAVTFTNTSSYTLPETGGAGTYRYTAGGLLITAAAILLYICLKRRNKDVPSF